VSKRTVKSPGGEQESPSSPKSAPPTPGSVEVPQQIELLDISGPPADLTSELELDVPPDAASILKNPTANRAKPGAARRPPTRRPVRNNMPQKMG